MALLSEIACGIFVLVITVWEAVKLYRLRFKYFSEVWNVLQLSALVLFYIAVVVYTLRLVITRWFRLATSTPTLTQFLQR